MSKLKVSTISDPDNDNTAFTVDSSGNVTFTGDVDLSAVTVTGIGGGSAFYAKLTSSQTISQNTNTKLQFGSEQFDLESDYDNSAYRFTPTTEGYYQISLAVQYNGTAGRAYYMTPILMKNGSQDKTCVNSVTLTNGAVQAMNVSALIYMNGTTDYLEPWVYHFDYSAGSTATAAADHGTYFTGYLVRAA